jgi:hypothetical protein
VPTRFLAVFHLSIFLTGGLAVGLTPPLARPLAAQTTGSVSGAVAGSVSGTVLGRFERDVRPLPFALVEAWTDAYRRSVVADSLGRYQLAAVPAGRLHVRATHAGHEPVLLDVVVPSDGPVLVDLELRARPVELPPIDVTAGVAVPHPGQRTPTAAGATTRVDAAAIEIGSGVADAGLVDAVRALGGNDPGQASDVLFMRGSTTDLKLVLLDGAPVYTPFHVAGLLRSFEPSVLGSADLHVGGAPARYDGGLTYILDLKTRRPSRDRVHASGSLDLLSGTVALDGPLGGRAGVVASARTLHNLARTPLGASPYGYRDGLVAFEVEAAPGQILHATGFWNRESVVLDIPETVELLASAAPDEAWWSNRSASAGWQGHVGGFLTEANVAASGYEARLPFRPSATSGNPDPAALLAYARTTRLRGGVEAARAMQGGTVRLGMSWETADATYLAAPLERGATPSAARTSSSSVGGYADATRALAPGLTLRAGVRADRFSGDDAPRVAPRAAITWEVTPEATLTMATGRYHQSTRASDLTVEATFASTAAGNPQTADLLPVATADHVIMSFDQVMGERVRLGISGFWKSYRGLLPAQVEPVRSSGVDLRVQRRGEHATAWLGYGLSWYWSDADLSGAATDFTGRQLLTAGLTGPLGSLFGADVRIAYGAGLPYTSVPLRASSPDAATHELSGTGDVIEQTPPLPGGPHEDFLRLDVELYATFTPEWGGHGWEIRPYVRVLNALDRRDALFYAFQPWRSDALTPLAERPLVPVVGMAWRF